MARPANSSDKNRKFLLNRLQDMYGKDFDPIMMAAKNAKEMNDLAQIELTEDQMAEMEGKDLLNFTDAIFARKKECVAAFDKIAQYVQPKLKAIEISGDLEISSHESWLEKLNETK